LQYSAYEVESAIGCSTSTHHCRVQAKLPLT
jgi:hypothetical protein